MDEGMDRPTCQSDSDLVIGFTHTLLFIKVVSVSSSTTVQDRDTGRSSEQNEEFILLCISCLTIILQHVFCCALSI